MKKQEWVSYGFFDSKESAIEYRNKYYEFSSYRFTKSKVGYELEIKKIYGSR